MPDILQDLPIAAPPDRVFEAVASPAGLDAWWTLGCRGERRPGATWDLDFGPGYAWRAEVSRWQPGEAFALTVTRADADWTGTTVGFLLLPTPAGTQVRFAHRGWPDANEHFRISCHCWALYLRLLRKYVERGESVPYARRLGD